MLDNKIIQSYVWHDDKRFFVSTIERDSSADLGPRRYNETIVWEWPEGQKERGKMIAQEGDSRFSIFTHNKLCNDLYEYGEVRS